LHRYFDPAVGRYISADPIGQLGGMNVYTYGGDDPVNRADPTGLDTAIISNGRTSGNPFGHSGLAFTGRGTFSQGNDTDPGSSTTDYLSREAARRNSAVTIVPTTPEQEQAMIDYLNSLPPLPPQPSLSDPLVPPSTDTCAKRVNDALREGGVLGPDSSGPLDFLPRSVWSNANSLGGETIVIPKGGGVPSRLGEFNPR
jgi:uncharacterized protein RhaS with RHS repeats